MKCEDNFMHMLDYSEKYASPYNKHRGNREGVMHATLKEREIKNHAPIL